MIEFLESHIGRKSVIKYGDLELTCFIGCPDDYKNFTFYFLSEKEAMDMVQKIRNSIRSIIIINNHVIVIPSKQCAQIFNTERVNEIIVDSATDFKSFIQKINGFLKENDNGFYYIAIKTSKDNYFFKKIFDGVKIDNYKGTIILMTLDENHLKVIVKMLKKIFDDDDSLVASGYTTSIMFCYGEIDRKIEYMCNYLN